MLKYYLRTAAFLLACSSMLASAALLMPGEDCYIGTEATCGPNFTLDSNPNLFTATYRWDGLQGHLSIVGQIGNASFLDGQLDLGTVAAGVDPAAGLTVIPGTKADLFQLNIYVDSSGNFVSGDVDLDGRVFSFDGVPLTASTDGGVALDGDLVFGDLTDSGSLVTLDGSGDIAAIAMDFFFCNDPSALTAEYAQCGSWGIVNITGFDNAVYADPTAANVWTSNWDIDSLSAAVVLPVPGALILFMSGMLPLVGIRAMRKR